MSENYEEKYPSCKCSYNVYRSAVSKDVNTSFTKLGVEQSELCLAHEKAEHEHLSANVTGGKNMQKELSFRVKITSVTAVQIGLLMSRLDQLIYKK